MKLFCFQTFVKYRIGKVLDRNNSRLPSVTTWRFVCLLNDNCWSELTMKMTMRNKFCSCHHHGRGGASGDKRTSNWAEKYWTWKILKKYMKPFGQIRFINCRSTFLSSRYMRDKKSFLIGWQWKTSSDLNLTLAGTKWAKVDDERGSVIFQRRLSFSGLFWFP